MISESDFKPGPSQTQGIDGAVSLSRTAQAWTDVSLGLKKYWLWSAMAFQDIRLRYRGSLLGPFWLTLSTIIMIGSMGVIYPHLFHTSIRTYLPFLAIGLIVWQFVQTMITESCAIFTGANNMILQSPMPFSVHAYRLVARNFIVFAHNFVIVPIILVLFGVPTSISAIETIPALLLTAINGVWLGLFFGMVAARFRDIPPIVTSALQVLFFITPIFWAPDVLGKWKPFFELNPIFALIDVIRAPLLGEQVAATSWPSLLITTALGSIFAFWFFARFRSRIPYWI